MTAAATRTTVAEYHVAKLDRRQSVGFDQIIHPGACNAVADKGEQMWPGKRIILSVAAMERRMRHDRIGELNWHTREDFAKQAANKTRVTRNDWIVEFA